MSDVVCTGILVADTFCGPLKALPPAGALVALESMPAKAGGCAANVAICLAKQGLSVEVGGLVGADPEADMLLACLSASGVGVSAVARSATHPTSKTVILLVEGEDRRYLHSFGANGAFRVADVDETAAMRAKVFYLGGLFAMPSIDIDELTGLFKRLKKAGVTTVVDVVIPRDDTPTIAQVASLLPYVDCFVPNQDEARTLTGCDDPQEQIRILREAGIGTVVVTRGVEGAIASFGQAADETIYEAGAFPVDAVDPSGSGDAYCAGIITGLVAGWSPQRSMIYAATLGYSAVLAVGTTDGVFAAPEAEAFADSTILSMRSMRPQSDRKYRESPWKRV